MATIKRPLGAPEGETSPAELFATYKATHPSETFSPPEGLTPPPEETLSMPPSSSPTPLGPGSFALPGQASTAAPFRTPSFMENRFVGGGSPNPLPVGSLPGGAPLSPSAVGGTQGPENIDPELLRQLFGGLLRRR